MRIKTNNILDKLSDVAFATYLIILYLFEFDTANLALTYFAFILYAFIVCYKTVIRKQWDFGNYITFGFLFVLFCTVSCFWADKPSDSVVRITTLWQVFILFLIVYHDFKYREDKGYIFKCLFVAGLILTVYTIAINGFSGIIEQMEAGERLNSETSNINDIGMNLAITVIIGLYYVIFRKKIWIVFLIILPFIISVSTASKKVIIMYIIAIIMLSYFKGGSHFIVKLLKISAVVVVLIAIMIQFSDMPIFNTITGRFEGMFAIFNGNDTHIDASTRERNILMENAWEIFKRNPIIGCGIDNFAYNNARLFGGLYVYSHNNYLELLADLGITGTFFYYAMYGKIIFGLTKGIKNINLNKIMMFIIFINRMVNEVAMVTYFSKITWVYLAVGFAMLTVNSSANNMLQSNSNNK